MNRRLFNFKKDYFNKKRLLKIAKKYAKLFPDAQQKEEAIKSKIADIESLGFF